MSDKKLYLRNVKQNNFSTNSMRFVVLTTMLLLRNQSWYCHVNGKGKARNTFELKQKIIG